MMQIIKNFFGFGGYANQTSRGSASEFLAHGDRDKKQKLFTEALKKADRDQQEILSEYERKFQRS